MGVENTKKDIWPSNSTK